MRKLSLFVFRALATLAPLLPLLTGCSNYGSIATPPPTPQPTPKTIVVPKLAIAANRDENTLSTYSINASTGELLNSGSVASGGAAPIALAVDPAGHFAYVANLIVGGGGVGGGGISAFSINTDTGALTPVGSPVAAGDGPALWSYTLAGDFFMAPACFRITSSPTPSIPVLEHSSQSGLQ